MDFERFDEFCGSPFWNTTLTWGTEYPDLTICFKETILVIVPAIFLWALLPLEIYYFRTSIYRDVPWNWKNVSKLLITAAISMTCICEILLNLSLEEPPYNVNIYMPIVKKLTVKPYFHENSTVLKSPSSLWCEYSMLKSTLFIEENIDICKYPKLRTFLKRRNDGYKPKKSNVFDREDVNSFLFEAPDDIYSMMKVVMIMGIAGACRSNELCAMKIDNVELRHEVIIVTIPDSKNGMARKFTMTKSEDEKILSGVLIYYNKKYGMQASGHQFIFWLLCTISGLPQFITEIHNIQNGAQTEKYFLHINYLVYYPMITAMFLLNCFADEPPRFHIYEKTEHKSTLKNCSFLGRITLTHVDGLLFTGYRKPLERDDMWRLGYENETKHLVPKFEKIFREKMMKNKKTFLEQKHNAACGKPKKVSVLPIIFQCFYGPYIQAVCYKILISVPMFIRPQLLSLILAHVGSDEVLWKGILYASGMFICGIISAILNCTVTNSIWLFGFHSRTCLVACIYRKALRISNAARKDRTVGEIVNLMAVDAQKFQDGAFYLPAVWSSPIEVSLALYFIWREVGPAVLVGFCVLLLLMPLNVFIVRSGKKFQVKQMKQKDERVKVMNEILNGIKVLKLYAWEPSFQKLVGRIRLGEIATVLKSAYLNAVAQCLYDFAPFLVTFVTFGTYVLMDEGNVLSASKVFVSLVLFNILRNSLRMFPEAINSLVQVMVAAGRINSFLNSEELESYVEHNADEAEPIVIENGSFSWGDDVILKNINLRVPKNSLVAVVGPVGCGKSSIINALLGEMNKIEGWVNTYGKVALVSQQAWIQNATVKENILFGKPFDETRYNKIIDACALRPDLEILADGDMTEIGEKGINLSGGQKQRVNLARAVYDDADIYLLDDPLSAVDSHVGRHIFDHVIGPNGLLKDKVRVLVTHAVTYLPKTQKIFVMKDGEISESGSYTDLLSENGVFAEFLMQHIADPTSDEEGLEEVEEQIEKTPLTPEIKRKITKQRSRLRSVSLDGSEKHLERKTFSTENISSSTRNRSETRKKSVTSSKWIIEEEKSKQMKGKLIQIEKSEKGNVKIGVFTYYLAAVGVVTTILAIILYGGCHGFGIAANLWLGMWTEDPNAITADGKVDTGLRNMNLIVYLVLGISQGACMFAANYLFARGGTSASKKLHNRLMRAVMRAPMHYFDVTPVGRILARFSSDIVGVDSILPYYFNFVFNFSLKILGALAVICFITPYFTFVAIPIAVLYISIQRYYISSSIQLKRLESVSRSPIYTHFSETLTGTAFIRAYGCSDRFINEFEKRVDANLVYLIPSNFAINWLGFRLEIIGNIIVLASALFAVLNRDLSAALVGLSISYALQITLAITYLSIMISNVETAIVSVERIKEYCEIEQEKPWTIDEKRPNKAWPNEGSICFKNYSVNYRPGLDLVLKRISFQVNGGEKVGIVGRTGAGKSSLTLSLFRIIEATEGEIFIDGIRISEIGLHDLRSRLTIIPQDAIIFSGTLRMNLDPFDKYSNEEIWRAIEFAHLKTFVSSLPAGLRHELSEGGDNLSVGQRQLICLARALLRKTKILILDEATAAVDLETDDLIQKTIRTAFGDCTVLTIAHRLNTILDSNRVLVLDNGEVAEFDTPGALLENDKSVFFGMCKNAGLVG